MLSMRIPHRWQNILTVVLMKHHVAHNMLNADFINAPRTLVLGSEGITNCTMTNPLPHCLGKTPIPMILASGPGFEYPRMLPPYVLQTGPIFSLNLATSLGPELQKWLDGQVQASFSKPSNFVTTCEPELGLSSNFV